MVCNCKKGLLTVCNYLSSLPLFDILVLSDSLQQFDILVLSDSLQQSGPFVWVGYPLWFVVFAIDTLVSY